MSSETTNTEVNDIEKLEEEISKRQKMLEKSADSQSQDDKKDMELFFGDEDAAKPKVEEPKADMSDAVRPQEKPQEKKVEVSGLDKVLSEKEEYLLGREKFLNDFEKALGLKQNEVSQRIEELRKKDLETRKLQDDARKMQDETRRMQEEHKKTVSETEVLKKELDEKKDRLKKSEELAAAEEKIASAKEDLALKETKIGRMSEELDRKRAALQAMEKELAEKKVRIEDEERRVKIIKDGLETKIREFDETFREESKKLQHKADEIKKYMTGSSTVKPMAAEHKVAPNKPVVFNEPAKQLLLDEEAIRKKAIERVERKLAQDKIFTAPAAEAKTADTECEPTIKQTPKESVAEPVKQTAMPISVVAETVKAAAEPVKEKEKQTVISVNSVYNTPTAEEEEDILAQERAMLAAAAENPSGAAQQCKTCDDLLKLVEKDKKVDTRAAARLLNVGEEEINKWASELKKQGFITLRNRFMGGTDIEMTKDAMKKVENKKEDERVSEIKKELERIREEQRRMRGGM